jgi:HlyD family secretion protein
MRFSHARRLVVIAGACTVFSALVVAGWAYWSGRPTPATQPLPAETQDIAIVTRGTFLKTLRLGGLVEAVEFVPVQAPQLVGAGGRPIVITYLAPNGTTVQRGDVVVEFDRQQELRTARDRRAEWLDLDAQVQKRRAELAAQDARNDTTLERAETAVSMAKLEMLKNDMLPRIEAEKHMMALATAEATLTPLRRALTLKHAASDAEIRILETRRDRLAVVARQAERNAERMAVRSPITGLVVYRPMWRRGQFGDPQEGLELWRARRCWMSSTRTPCGCAPGSIRSTSAH